MFTKFYEIPSLPFKDIEKKQNIANGRMEALTDGRTDVKKSIPPPHAQFAGGV